MKVDKGDVLTFRLRVDDVGVATPFLAGLLESMRGHVFHGVMVTASARGDVFAERDELLDEQVDDLVDGEEES